MIRDNSGLTLETVRSSKRCDQGRLTIDPSIFDPHGALTVFCEELYYYCRCTERKFADLTAVASEFG